MNHDRPGSSTAVTKVELKRAEPSEVIAKDPVLAAAPVVKALGPGLLSKGVLRRFADKAVVMQQNDAGHSLFIVLAGEARLFARKDSDSAELGVARRGDVLGEAEVLAGGGKRKTSAVAQGQLDVLELSREGLLSNGQLPAALRQYLELISSNRMKALDEMSDFLNRW